jgi:drug/metabolite transporter (DMT)-like permease
MKLSRGALFMLAAMTAISLMHLTVKFLSHIPVWQIILCRSVISISACIPVFFRIKISPMGENKFLLLLRGISGMAGLVCFFYSIHHMPLSTAIITGNLMPFFTLFMAAVFLNEKVKPGQWICFLISFTGILIIKGFDTDISLFDFIIALAGAFFAGVAHFLVRKLKSTDHTAVIMFYLPLVTIPVAIFFTEGVWVKPSSSDWVILLVNGILTHLGQLFLTKAYKEEEVNAVSGIYFLGIVFAVFSGVIMFGEVLTVTSVAGMLMVILGLFINLKIKSLN